MFTFALATYLMAKGFTACSVITYGAFFGARCGWVQHEGGHNSLTGNIWIDKRIQACLMGFGLGTSGDMWNIMHNKHHATPQKIRHDMDLDTTPAVAFFNTAVEENRERGFSRLWSRFQAWTFVPITSGVFVMAFWLYVLHPSKVMKKKNFEEAAWMLSSHVVRASLIQFVHPANISFAHACTPLRFPCGSPACTSSRTSPPLTRTPKSSSLGTTRVGSDTPSSTRLILALTTRASTG